MVLEYHSPDRIKYEKETIPYMQELSRVDLKMLSESQKIASNQKQANRAKRYGKNENEKGRNQRTAGRIAIDLSSSDQSVCVDQSGTDRFVFVDSWWKQKS